MNNSRSISMCSDRSRTLLKEYAETIDIVRSSLSDEQNIRTEFIRLLGMLEETRQKWNMEKLRADTLQQQLIVESNDKSAARQECQIVREQLRDARAQIITLMTDKQSLEHEIAEMERKFATVGELLKDEQSLLKENDGQKLAFLNNEPVLQEPTRSRRRVREIRRGASRTLSRCRDADHDKTGDSLEISYDDSDESHLRDGKVYRRSRSLATVPGTRNSVAAVKRPKESTRMGMVEEEMGTPCKRSKDGTETIITTTTTITVDPEGRIPTTADVSVRRSMNRSMSESNILNQKGEVVTQSVAQNNTLNPRYGASALDLRSPYSAVKTWTNGASIETRPHTYTHFTSLLVDRCEVCNRWVGLAGKAAYKCTDCGIRLHKTCVKNAPIPCVPRTPTPRTPGKQRPRLKDFCPSTQPMIPPLVIHCVLALDKDRLNTEGIYRIPGHESQVVKLLNEFKNGRCLPKLEYQDTETITGCLKRFLRELRDTVIPTSSWEEFVNAAETRDIEALNHSVMDLPYPNRDTLAFLCAHFQKVCDNSIRNKMTPEVLARSIAPTIVGHAPPRSMSMAQNSDEIAKQIMVFLALLRMPHDYWPNFYAFDQGRPLLRSPTRYPATYDQESKTPLRPPTQPPSETGRKDPNKSMLGPIETSPTGQQLREYQPLSSKRGRIR